MLKHLNCLLCHKLLFHINILSCNNIPSHVNFVVIHQVHKNYISSVIIF